MSNMRKRTQRRATLLGGIIAFATIFTVMIGLIAPDLRSSNSSTQPLLAASPSGLLTPTPLIAPTPELNPQLEGRPPHVHTSGYFQAFYPAGPDWYAEDDPQPENGAYIADDTFISTVIRSGDRLAVIHNYIKQGVEYESLDTLSQNYLTVEHFAEAWASYQSWQETGRRQSDRAVIVDFKLVADGNNYLGRDITWVDAGWAYVTRLVVPSNNPDLLNLLEKLTVPAFVGYHDLQTLPRTWPAYVDQKLGFILKYPATWSLVAGDIGRPVTFNTPEGQTKAMIRAWTVPNQPVGSTSEAEVWLKANEPTAVILGSAPVEHELGSGYQVAYGYQDQEGDRHSGLAVLLVDSDQTLFVAILHLDTPDVNFLDAESLFPTDNEARLTVASGFIILPPQAREIVPVEAGETATPNP